MDQLPDRPPALHRRQPDVDRNLRFHLYDLLAPSRRVDDLLAEIDQDLICIFWG